MPESTPSRVAAYLADTSVRPLLLAGDAVRVLESVPAASVDLCMTSPPYWGHREYEAEGIGRESSVGDYIDNLLAVFAQVHRVLKPTGSCWLNLGDTYRGKRMQGIPWRVAIRLCDDQGWVLRNDVIWNKVKGSPDNAVDKLRNVHEHVFHFVKQAQGYYYDVDAIRSTPQKAKVRNGAVVSATGVSGIRYKRQIELSTALSDDEKRNAYRALDGMLDDLHRGKVSDFRMIIRGQQRTTHSDAASVSGRAKELRDKGFYFLRYHPNGAKPSDVWDIVPEDTQARETHYAPYPQDLCRIPIQATCPPGGVVLDPFCGTGTTMLVATQLQRRSIGIDLSREYLDLAADRCRVLA